MIELQVERGVPVPERVLNPQRVRRMNQEHKDFIRAMAVGDSFTCDFPTAQCLRVWARRQGIRLVTSREPQGLMRVWRVELSDNGNGQ